MPCCVHWPVGWSAWFKQPTTPNLDKYIVVARAVGKEMKRLTNGSPQYVQLQIWGLSRLMKIRGCPRGPPPPSQDTTRSLTQRTGCLWISSIAASGCGYTHCELVFVPIALLYSPMCPQDSQPLRVGFPMHINSQCQPHTWSSNIICSNLGPVIASSLGC